MTAEDGKRIPEDGGQAAEDGGRQTPDDLLTDDQAAHLVGVAARTIRGWRTRRGLPYTRITHQIARIRRADLLAWVAEHRVTSNGIKASLIAVFIAFMCGCAAPELAVMEQTPAMSPVELKQYQHSIEMARVMAGLEGR